MAEAQILERELVPTAGVLRPAGIAGVGRALPDEVVPNAEIAERLGIAPDWIERRTGITERRRAAPGERLSELASRAAFAALADARIPPADVDLVLVATITADEITPSAASLVAARIGAEGAGAVDVGAACSGFVTALALAGPLVESGRAETVLVVGADLMSRVLDYRDRPTAGLFGDGAGAVVITPTGAGTLGPTLLGSDGSQAPMIVIHRARGLIEMDGHATFIAAVDNLSATTVALCEQAGLALDEIDLFVYHQANGRILKAVGERLGLACERVFDCIARLGNTTAATVPMALSLAADDGLLPRPGNVLLAAFGAGLAWSGAILSYPEKS